MKFSAAKILLSEFLKNPKDISLKLNHRGIQSLTLLISMIGSMGLNLFISVLTSRALGPSQYGDLKFIQTIWSIIFLIITFGFLYSGSQLLLKEKSDKSSKEIIGLVLLLSLFMGVGTSIITIIMAFPIDLLFRTSLSSIIIFTAILIPIISMQSALMLILQSINEIVLMSLLLFIPPLLYLIGLFILPVWIPLTTTSILFLQQLSVLFVVLVIIFVLKPQFSSMKYWFSKTQFENKTFGWPIYFGSVIDGLGTYVNRLAISFFANNASVGFYSLAYNLCEPLKLIPNAVSTTAYKDFSGQNKVSSKLLNITIFTSLLTFLLSWIFFGKPLSLLYSSGFESVGPMARALSISSIAWGFGDFFNRFLRAHGYGKVIRNSSYFLGIINLICLFTIVPLLKEWGVVLTTIAIGLSYVLFMIFSYKKIFLAKKLNE